MNLFPFAKTTCILIATLCAIAARAQNININITALRSSQGQVMISVFKNEQQFKDNKPVQRFRFAKKDVVNGVLSVACNLPPGTYGFACLDDENGNGKMEENFVGIPKEGFGFSNFYLSGMSRPSFNDFKFEVKDQPVKVVMKTRYM